MTLRRSARAAALLFALTAAAAAQDAPPPEQPTEPELELKVVGSLESPGGVPLAFSADGKSLVYVKCERSEPNAQGDRSRAYIYVKAAADGSGATELFTTPVAWDDILVLYSSPGAISADGKRVIAVTNHKDGVSYKKGFLAPLVLEADGTRTPIATSMGGCMGYGFAGERLLVLEVKPDWRKEPGYSLEAWKGGKSETIHADPKAISLGLRVSPDGKKAAFLMVDPANGRNAIVRVIDLETRKATDSDSFRTDDFTFDGPPYVLWDAESKGVYAHASLTEKSKRPFGLFRVDATTGKRERVVDLENVGVTAVLGDGLLAVYMRDDTFRGAAVLRLADKRLFKLQKRDFVLGGKGKRLALFRSVDGKDTCQLVDFTLPK
ncbi:MAG: hypothetical protein AB7N76_14510 [Planctomycetota bacterium]